LPQNLWGQGHFQAFICITSVVYVRPFLLFYSRNSRTYYPVAFKFSFLDPSNAYGFNLLPLITVLFVISHMLQCVLWHRISWQHSCWFLLCIYQLLVWNERRTYSAVIWHCRCFKSHPLFLQSTTAASHFNNLNLNEPSVY
jgi:hypothetical protein